MDNLLDDLLKDIDWLAVDPLKDISNIPMENVPPEVNELDVEGEINRINFELIRMIGMVYTSTHTLFSGQEELKGEMQKLSDDMSAITKELVNQTRTQKDIIAMLKRIEEKLDEALTRN